MLNSTKQYIEYGKRKICYDLFITDRKQVEISVLPDQCVVVKSPRDISLDKVKSIISKRARWITKQQRFFEQFSLKTPPRSFIGGETHMYLGKKYRLKIKEVDNYTSVKLKRGYFYIEVKNKHSDLVKRALEEWYRKKALYYFNNMFEACWKKLKRENQIKPNLIIRKMKSRWGSLSENNNLSINFDLIKAPKECIEYVIIHELCHMTHNNHSSEFYNLLEQYLPDWRSKKLKLEQKMI